MSRRGTTLIEVAVALLVLAVAGLALAGAIAGGERARRRAVEEGVALTAAEAWLERWRAGPWSAAPGSGADTIDRPGWRGTVEWSVRSLDACREEARVSVGMADRPWPPARLTSRRFREGVPCDP